MLPRKLRQFLKYGVYGVFGSLAVGGVAVAVKYHDDYQAMPLLRIMRAAFTAVDIGKTYRKMLYSQNWDTSSSEYLEVKSKAHQLGADKLLELCRANKGVYIKVGQHIGAMDYLLPDEYVSKMRILHNAAPQNTIEELYKVIREDLKQEPQEIFDDFEPEPLGTASLAQVHKAKLKDGTVVAVKVQHHYVQRNVHIDLAWIELIVNTMQRIFPEFEMNWLVSETKKNIAKELNFINEGRNAEKVASLFQNYKWLKVPKIYWPYTTERVLVMEYVSGGLVNDTKFIKENKIDKYDLCKKLGDLYSHMIFVTGFVHSDPHPGNILINKEPGDKEVTVYLLDHGLYANLTEKFRYDYSKLWLAIIHRDREEMKKYSEKLGIRQELYILFSCMVSGRPWESIVKGIDRTKPTSKEKAIFQNEIPKFLNYLTECLEHVDRQALLVLKTNDLIRSIEYALGTQDRMCGFIVMTKCCLESVYNIEHKHTGSFFKRQYISMKYGFTLLMFYFYSLYLDLLEKVNDCCTVSIPYLTSQRLQLA